MRCRPKFKRAFDRTGGRCFYCGCALAPDDADWPADVEGTVTIPSGFSFLTLDHLVPKASGGKDDDANLVAACYSCNSRKRHRSLEEYRALRERQTGISQVFFGEAYRG